MGWDLVGLGAAPDWRPVLHCAIGSCYRHGVLSAVGRVWGEDVAVFLRKFKKPKPTETVPAVLGPPSRSGGPYSVKGGDPRQWCYSVSGTRCYGA